DHVVEKAGPQLSIQAIKTSEN
ncbi:MAG: hypothetical protein ACD_44C00202G0009, partial [uncultured bacterium]